MPISGTKEHIISTILEEPSTKHELKKIRKPYILPSGAYTIRSTQLKYYAGVDKRPEPGDVVLGRIVHVGQHSSLENKSGRIHTIYNGTVAIFVFANRYAPDYYEAFVPDLRKDEVDLIARSGLVGDVKTKNRLIKDPSRVKILGYVCEEDGTVVNTRRHPLIVAQRKTKAFPRAKMILVCGATMNSGKSAAAAACCLALSSLGLNVRASKVTGTASLKDILHMNDAGASSFSDFSFLGYPSTYLVPPPEVIGIFNTLDLKFANNPRNYWIVEFADGINQKETAILLSSNEVRTRIHKLVFCANDAFSAIGGIHYMKSRFGVEPDIISGVCTSSPLHVRELEDVTQIPIFHSMELCPSHIKDMLL